MCELLEKAREAQGGISYYEIAKRLGVSTALMNKWKNNKSQPNGLNTLKLVEMAKLTPEQAIKIMEKGSMKLGMIFTVAFASLLLFATCTTEVKAAEILAQNSMQVHDSYIHYANVIIWMYLSRIYRHFVKSKIMYHPNSTLGDAICSCYQPLT